MRPKIKYSLSSLHKTMDDDSINPHASFFDDFTQWEDSHADASQVDAIINEIEYALKILTTSLV